MIKPINSIRMRVEAGSEIFAFSPSEKPPVESGFFQDAFFDSGISSCWRKNTSCIEAVELANLLRALRKVAGHLGENPGRIEYAGMSGGNGPVILIEPDMVMGTYPVPVENVDFLVGLVVHQALYNIEWSEHVWKILEPYMDTMSPMNRVKFQKLVRTGESIYLDQRADRSVFGLYTRIAQGVFLEKYKEGLKTVKATVDELIYHWWRGLLNPFPGPLPSEYQPALLTLYGLTSALNAVHDAGEGVVKRCEKRAGLYLDTWTTLAGMLDGLRLEDKHLVWFSNPPDSVEKKKGGEAPASKRSICIPPLLAREIEERLAVDTADLTPVIRSVAGYDDESVVPMSRWDFNIPSHPVIDKRMVSRLKSVFISYADRRTLISRGLAAGRIDSRRLYRAALTGRCFQTAERVPCLDWSVGLLVDASGSMRGRKWRMVENTVANIHKAIGGRHNRLNAWAYFEVNGICMISTLIQQDRLLSIPPAGQTASGQAIIAAASMIPKKAKRKILIHVTDGESNLGCDVSLGIEFCREQHIHLITLGCGYKNRAAMEEQYGRGIQFVDYFEQLPKAMESLLKWVFVYLWKGPGQKKGGGP
jgi:hypothetical protein